MRILAVLLVTGCGLYHQNSCPATSGEANGTPCDGEFHCEYAEPNGRTDFCTCQLGHLWCSDCDSREYGFGACQAGQSCSYSSWETDCDCTCSVRGNWNCSSTDAVSPCPRDPDPVDAGVD